MECQGHDKDCTLAVRCFCGLSRSRSFDRPRQLPHVTSHNSPSRPQRCSRDIEDGLWGQMGAAQKPSQQHLAGETSLLRDFRSPTVVARVLVTSRMNHRSGYRVGEGLHRTGVTVEPCQWETSQQNSTGSSKNLDRSTTRFGNGQTTLRRHKQAVVLSSAVIFLATASNL